VANTLSHSYTFDKTLPVDEIVEESYERIGIINVSGYQLKTAKRSLNLLFSEWSNTIRYTGKSAATGAANLTGGVRGSNGTTAATHSSADAVTQHATGMDNILEVNYRITSTSVDSPMTEVSRSQYQGYSNKSAKGTPTSYFVQRFIDRTTITIYLTPGSAEDGNKLNLYYVRRIQDAGAYTNATNVPYRFAPCMTAGLSFYLSQKNAPQRSQELKLYYEDELARAIKEDADITSTYIAPKVYFPNA
jgi:hypothetical protein